MNKAIEPPSSEAIQMAVENLVEFKALTAAEDLTPLGHYLAQLPVDIHIGKLLLFGAIFRCIDPILTIASILSSKSPFVSPIEQREEASAAHKT